jgi:positive regulator of sigma E activity
MIEPAQVIKLDNRQALLSLQSTSACAKCGKCLLAQNGEMQLWAADQIGVKPGDKVLVEISSRFSIFASFMIFIFPVASIISGYFIGAYFSELFSKKPLELWGIVFSLFALVLSGLVLFLADKYFKSLSINPCRIISIQ